MSLKEIETKIRSILEVKRCKTGLCSTEQSALARLDHKYRRKNGHLKKGSYYINSAGKWAVV